MILMYKGYTKTCAKRDVVESHMVNRAPWYMGEESGDVDWDFCESGIYTIVTIRTKKTRLPNCGRESLGAMMSEIGFW